MGVLDILPQQLDELPPAAKLNVKALLNIRQALFDILGAFPQDNVLPYFYQFSLTTAKANALAASATGQASIKISADAAFVACSVRGRSTGGFTAFMRIDSSDRQLMNEQIVDASLVGTAERPGPLHKPLLLPANTTMSFDLTNLTGAANEIYFTLGGFKVYNRKIS